MGVDDQHWACAECARQCSKVHGRSPPSRMAFFKIMFGPFKDSLVVPPKFARLLKNLAGQNFYLENSDGNRWRMKLQRVNNTLGFQEGWNEFVSYHSIQCGEIVVFEYIDPCSFCVQIYGLSGCVRSHFYDNVDSDPCRLPTHHSSVHNDGGKNDACKVSSSVQANVSPRKLKPIRNRSSESLTRTYPLYKTDCDIHKRNRSNTDCMEDLHNDVRTTDELSSKKRNMVAISSETLSPERAAARDTMEEINVRRMPSSHAMASCKNSQTAATADCFEVPCTVVCEDTHEGQQTSQTRLLNICDNINARSKDIAPEKKEKARELTTTFMPANVNVSEMDCTKLQCELSEIDSQKTEEMIDIMPSKFMPIGSGTENTDKSAITEEKSSFSFDSKLSQSMSDERCKVNENIPTSDGMVNISSLVTEIGFSITNCLDIVPIRCERNGVYCKRSEMELPADFSYENIVSGEELSVGGKDGMLHRASTNELGHSLNDDNVATYIFLVDKEGTCHVVQNFHNPLIDGASAGIYNNDFANTNYNDSLAHTIKEVPFVSGIVAGDRNVNEESSKRTIVISAVDDDHPAKKLCLDTTGANQDFSSHENDQSSPGELALSSVKVEMMDPDDLPLSYPTFSLVVNNLSFLELPASLPPSSGRFRLDKKVMMLRDQAMRLWPVLYQESLSFTGFLGGWEAFATANNIREGDICHFETISGVEPMLNVRISSAQAPSR